MTLKAKDSIRHWSPITHESTTVYSLNGITQNVYSLTASKDIVAFGIGLGFYVVCNINSPENCEITALPRIDQNDPLSSTIDYTINYLVCFICILDIYINIYIFSFFI